MAKIGQDSLYSPVAPIVVLSGHADHQLLDFIQRARASGTTLLTAIILSGDQSPMPGQERLRRDDGGQFMKYAGPVSWPDG
jgi:hypothetical protein